MKRIVLFFIFIAIALSSFSQGNKIIATATPNPVPQGSIVRVTYAVSGGNISAFQKPAFTSFIEVGSSQQTYINNGSSSINFVFQLVPSANIGKYAIQPAKIQIDGKWVNTPSLVIEVVAGKGGQAQAATPGNKSQVPAKSNTAPNTTANSGGQDIFIKAEVSKSNPYVGEHLVLTYKIYTRVDINSYSFSKVPSNKGFWEQPFTEKNMRGKQYNEIINGHKYIVAEIRKVSLVPQQSGPLKIEPLDIECAVVQQSRNAMSMEEMINKMFSDPFSNMQSTQQVKKKVSSNAVLLNVKPLPTAKQPTPFNGAVGDFQVKSEIDKTKVAANDAITLKVTVSGNGNLQLLDAPKFEFPSDFETYDPKVTEHINTTESGTSGTKTFEYVIIPRTPGEFTIPANSFSFFNPRANAYQTHPIPEYKISVSKGTGNTTVISSNQKDVKFIGTDIRYIKANNLTLYPIGAYFYDSLLFWTLFIFLAFLFLIFMVLMRKRLALRSNAALLKNKKATKVARKRLAVAEKYLSNKASDAFYIELSRAMWGYVSDKFTIPLASLSFENVNEVFQNTTLSDETAKEVISFLNDMEYARFAPSSELEQLDNAYKQAVNLILKIEKELK